MKIDRRLNLVIPLYHDEDKVYAYIHATPINREVFEKYHLVIARTLASITANGLGYIAGPRVAAMQLKAQAIATGSWEGTDGVQGLMAEIRRLSNVLAPTGHGWDMIPLEDAVSQNFLDADDVSEVENALAFFTVASWMYPRPALKDILEGAAKLWGAQIESLGCTDFMNSLTTSKPAASTGEKAIVSSIPH